MKDRVPVNPGRVLITPENGIAAYYATMTRADNSTQEGTPLNKNSLLKDATAALFGLGTDALPDDVLRKIASDIPNLYVWKKTGASYVEIVPTLSGPTGTTYSVGYNNESIQYSDELEVVSGALKLKNPSTVTITTSNYTSYSALLCGKYFTVTSNAGSKNYLHFGDDTALQIKSNTAGSYVAKGGWYISSYTEKTVTPDYGYVCSFDKNAYPPAVSDGFIYTALGMLGDKVRSATGSYKGTNTYGESNPNSLTLPFVPKAIFISSSNYAAMFIQGNSYGYSMNGSKSVDISEWTTTVKWYHSSSAAFQMNSGVTYYYVAFG